MGQMKYTAKQNQNNVEYVILVGKQGCVCVCVVCLRACRMDLQNGVCVCARDFDWVFVSLCEMLVCKYPQTSLPCYRMGSISNPYHLIISFTPDHAEPRVREQHLFGSWRVCCRVVM